MGRSGSCGVGSKFNATYKKYNPEQGNSLHEEPQLPPVKKGMHYFLTGLLRGFNGITLAKTRQAVSAQMTGAPVINSGFAALVALLQLWTREAG